MFIVSIKNLEYQAEKEARPKTYLKVIIPKKYYNFLDIFSKKNFNILFFYQKYDYKIILEEQQKHSNILLYKMLLQELNAIKHYLDLYLGKVFIQISLALYLSLFFFIKKLEIGIGFCIDYQKLNAIIKKD